MTENEAIRILGDLTLCTPLGQAAFVGIEAIKKLKEYVDLEEQGRLLKLPCAVGDTVYTLNPLPSGKIVIGETTADAFMCALGMLKGRFGETIFLTYQEAEDKLAEMEVIPSEKQ